MTTEATAKKHTVSVTTRVTTAVTGKMIIHSLIRLVFSCFFSGEYIIAKIVGQLLYRYIVTIYPSYNSRIT